MWREIKRLLTVPQDVQDAFWKVCVKKNNFSLGIICAIVFPAELFNVARVLFFTNSKLSTLNNRIYFGMYVALMLIAVVYLVLRRAFKNCSLRAQWRVQYFVMIGLFLWHILLNTYDFRSNPESDVYVYCTALIGISVFMHMPNRYMIPFILTGHLLFYILNFQYLDMGVMINVIFMFVVAIGMILSKCHSSVLEISQNKRIHEINHKLESLLEQDQMLAVLNKSAIEQRISHALRNVDRDNPIGLIMIDLDDFKNINDQFGHPCGDYILKELTQNLKCIFSDTVYSLGRIGGDEFLVLLPNPCDAAKMIGYAEALVKSTKGIKWQGKEVDASCSAGVLLDRRPGLEFDRLYREVDQLLYTVKQDRKGGYHFREMS